MEFVEMIIPFFMGLSTMILIGWIVWLVNRAARERRMRMFAIHEKMLEKFASSEEFAAFLRTSEGQRYFRSLTIQPAMNSRERVIKSVRTGVILIILGSGLTAISFLVGFARPMEELPFVIGFLALFLGIGFIASAVISYTLSKSWGLIGDDQNVPTTKES